MLLPKKESHDVAKSPAGTGFLQRLLSRVSASSSAMTASKGLYDAGKGRALSRRNLTRIAIGLCGVVLAFGIIDLILQTEAARSPPVRYREISGPGGKWPIDGVATVASGKYFTEKLLPVWLKSLRERAQWRGPVYIGCDECKTLNSSAFIKSMPPCTAPRLWPSQKFCL